MLAVVVAVPTVVVALVVMVAAVALWIVLLLALGRLFGRRRRSPDPAPLESSDPRDAVRSTIERRH